MKVKERKEKTHLSNKKINKMSKLELHSKIRKLLKTGDNSLYLRHLILNAYERNSLELVWLLKDICKHLPVQRRARYFWIVVKHQWGIKGDYGTFLESGGF